MNCPLCKKGRGSREQLVEHIEKAHTNQIPDNMNTYQYLYLLNYGKSNGSCIVCGAPTPWNTSTQKPARLCGKIECKDALRKEAKSNMDKTYGEGNHPVNDPEHQAKMQKNKKKNLIYRFKDGGEIICLSKDEYKLLNYLETFLEMTSNDVVECPYVFQYDDNGMKRNYLPDLYLVHHNLIIEQKDNNNTNPQFLKETRYKVKLKAEAVEKDGRFNYLIVYGSNYSPLLKTLYDIRIANINHTKDKIIVHNESVMTDIGVIKVPPFYIGLVKQMGEYVNIFIADDSSCNTVYIGDENYNLSRSSTAVPYFKDKQIELYKYCGEMGTKQVEFFRSWLHNIFYGIPTIELTSPPLEWVMDSLANNGVNLYIDNIINNNIAGNTDFALVLSKTI
jgi:hypothetical protein